MNARRPSGFSLMEVLLASGILLSCLVVLGQMAVVGRQHAEDAESLTAAQIACQAKLNEILVGAAPLASQPATSIEGMTGWSYQVEVQPLQQYDLVSLRVTVSPEPAAIDTKRPGKSFSLVRWMHAPGANARPDGSFPSFTPEDGSESSGVPQDLFPNRFSGER
ncbi:MAG: hypothetical protein JJ992_12580 [Planctomycetes bacterium]|nr:hypothetical protein [Planctomycetota bacterium]